MNNEELEKFQILMFENIIQKQFLVSRGLMDEFLTYLSEMNAGFDKVLQGLKKKENNDETSH